MITLDYIKRPVQSELSSFERFFRDTTRSEVGLLNLMVNYMIRTKGKQIRPLMVFLAAKMHGTITQRTYVAASTIELLHSASLVHDDVVDESYERRGFLSINALWKNKISVLMGDYLLSKGLLVATKEKEYEILDIVSEAVRDMAEGELLQYQKSRKLDMDEATYFEIIRKKTASLIGTSFAVGAHSAGADPEKVSAMRQIGVLAGFAFQIRDDIFDYQDKGTIGKPIGNDLKEKKITLPLIYVLQHSSVRERNRILFSIRKNNNRKEKVWELIERVRKNGGIEYATGKMNQFADDAIDLLNRFPSNEASQSLEHLIRYIIERKK
ncbi:MAG TPA: polyprenyl synthetase family protein [Prolixibacteraceae bacterium]|nr:polyprenyl synthetase family protein [Prolixibacteraceae bacterium]